MASDLQFGTFAAKQMINGAANALRYALICSLPLAAYLASAVPGRAAANNEGLPVIPLTIKNNLDSSSPVFVYVKGLVPQATSNIPAGSWVYVSNVNGDVTITPQIGQGVYRSLALNLGTLAIGATATLNVPKLNAVRIYVSYGTGVQVCCSAATGRDPSAPDGWIPTSPNFPIVYDYAEYTWDNTGNVGLGHTTRFNINTTQLDGWGLPLLLTLKGKSASSNNTVVLNAGFTSDRATMFNAYLQLGEPWTKLVQFKNGVPLRIISPYHGIQVPLQIFPSNALDSYISDVFKYYETRTLKVTANFCGGNHSFQGSTVPSSSTMRFTDAASGASFEFPMPSTLTVYLNEIHASQRTCLSEAVAAKLGGAFVRTNLLVNSNLDACDTSQFYQNPPIQKYAEFFHVHSVNHLAYSFGYDDTCSQNSTILVDDPTSLVITVGGDQPPPPAARAAHDFNADGTSDILWRNSSGAVALWLMGPNATIASAVGVGSVDPNVWTIIGQRDINGDKNADIILRATDGSIGEWLMNGNGTIMSANGLGNPTTNWTIVGTGDFNGDGIGDILWRGAGSSVVIWYMNNGGTLGSAVGVGSLPVEWVVAGTGDFDGDGIWDMLWSHTSGAIAVWLMNGNGTIKSANGLGTLPVGVWSIAGTGDFNGDKISDILLSGSGNAVGIWFMNSSGTVSSAQGAGAMASGWTIAQTGDYNGDGKSDILWYHAASGSIGAWLMNAASIASAVGIGSLPPASWTIVSANSE
jgi:hypothetical protein